LSGEKLALITGAAGGIGSAMVQAFQSAGWKTIAIDKVDADGVQRIDVSDPEQVEKLFEHPGEPLMALINNAAVQVIKPLIETSLEEWDTVVDTNLRSIYLMSKYAHPMLKQGHGAIVNIGSVHAIATSEGLAAYAASKGGVVALTRAMALELAPDGIRVNAILPGAIDTPMLHAGLVRSEETGMDDLVRRTPLGRIGQPKEIARAALFLADGDQASFITGQALVVDGGATARLGTE
jgi:NAD(P)-dependent dehydrogenase (short-subunit alcohol dehydrogenase family)